MANIDALMQGLAMMGQGFGAAKERKAAATLGQRVRETGEGVFKDPEIAAQLFEQGKDSHAVATMFSEVSSPMQLVGRLTDEAIRSGDQGAIEKSKKAMALWQNMEKYKKDLTLRNLYASKDPAGTQEYSLAGSEINAFGDLQPEEFKTLYDVVKDPAGYLTGEGWFTMAGDKKKLDKLGKKMYGQGFDIESAEPTTIATTLVAQSLANRDPEMFSPDTEWGYTNIKRALPEAMGVITSSEGDFTKMKDYGALKTPMYKRKKIKGIRRTPAKVSVVGKPQKAAPAEGGAPKKEVGGDSAANVKSRVDTANTTKEKVQIIDNSNLSPEQKRAMKVSVVQG